ncbi:MAG: ATP-binding protein [Limisphaerales bacterium]
MSERLSHEIARLAGRLGDFLAATFPRAEGVLAQNLAFLRANANAASNAPGQPSRRSGAAGDGPEPLEQLTGPLGLSQAEVDLLLLAGMPEEHEGFSAVLRSLHPRGEPRSPAGLAAQLIHAGSRVEFRSWYEASTVQRLGIVRLSGTSPFFERSLELADDLWPALHGIQVWPGFVPGVESDAPVYGLRDWLDSTPAHRAMRALCDARPCCILLTGDSEEAAFQRGIALVRSAGRQAAGIRITGTLDADRFRTLLLHALVRRVVLVLRFSPSDGSGQSDVPDAGGHPDTIVVCARTGSVAFRGARPLLGLPMDRMGPKARREMWREALPPFADSAALLAARYPVEPAVAAEIAADLASLESTAERAPGFDDVAHAVRTRASVTLGGGIKLIRPTATWSHLVLPPEREAQLRAAIGRLDLQVRVLDEWGFLKDRPGARGVRMLFSGPPGTGKTLSAEVLAGALNVDLLLVDISRVVSKWIGETEKNLAAVFDTAERAQAVLFFDEADALFGRRTEVSDAHDRYANLETAYLLARLERFEGLAILATNLRQNIDPAFLRRLEFVVDFEDPDREERQRLWNCHIPDRNLLDPEVNLGELAALYPVVGGFIRNATVAAAFLAAADGCRIGRSHFLRAIRREYEKSGRAFPGFPAGTPEH